jgi:hypothetical protein
MKDIVDRPINVDIVRHIMLDKLKVLTVQLDNVGHCPGQQAIHTDNVIASGQQIFAEM